MGLDLLVEGRAKPGHEPEWRALIGKAFAAEALSEAENGRLQEIIVPPHECVGAPRVGQDAGANAWIFEAREAKTPDEQAAVLAEFDGYYVLALVESDGVPKYSHGGLYEGLDETSFRGAFLDDCVDVLDKRVIEDAWNHKLPEAAVAYGQTLLAAASAAETRGAPARTAPKRGLLAMVGLGRKPQEAVLFEDQLDIVRSAGRWYVFWGERGHPIRAWF